MRLYMFPISDPNKSATKNPYIDKLVTALEKRGCRVVNKNQVNRYGVIDLLLNIKRVDTYYLNWIENLPDRRYGWIQATIFIFVLFVLKIFGKKIVWMMHNKLSHSKKGLFFKVVTNYLLVNYADYVFTHSLDGIRFGNILLKNNRQIDFIHHPLENNIDRLSHNTQKDIDILIWGSISPYKGIDTFLEYLQKSSLKNRFKIHIAGKITDSKLEEKLIRLQDKKIVIENDFVSFGRLEELFSKSSIVLFTYAGYSTLSSGALMDTLSYGIDVIGPNVGAFRDLNEEGLIDTFIDFDDLVKRLENRSFGNKKSQNRLKDFIKNNSWDGFADWICRLIDTKEIGS